MTLESFTQSLTKEKQFKVAITLTGLALPTWNAFADKNELTYHDGVMLMKHDVDRLLLQNTITAVQEYLNEKSAQAPIQNNAHLKDLSKQFDDPIVALHDSDWELPEEVKKIFYAVYNLLEAALGNETTAFNESTIYVSINQAADALSSSKTMDLDEINNLLAAIKRS